MIMRASFVLELIDAFSGKTLTDGCHFLLDGRTFSPLKKQEGFWVFCNLRGEHFEVTMQMPGYRTKTLPVQMKELLQDKLVLPVYLDRRREYSHHDCEWLLGECPPLTEVLAIADGSLDYRLQSQISTEKFTKIEVMGYRTSNLSRIWLAMGSQQKREVFRFVKRLSEDTFRTETALKTAFLQGEPIYRVYRSCSDRTGRYEIPVEIGQMGGIDHVEIWNKEKTEWDCLSLTAHN